MEGTIAEIRMFGGSFGPRGWALCQGQTLNISTNTALFSLIGTTFGGNGINTFQLPDFQGRMPVGAGSGAGLKPFSLGQVGGNNSITISLANMPSHNHGVTGTVSLPSLSDSGNNESPDGTFPASNGTQQYASTHDSNMGALAVNLATALAGSNQPVDNTPPYLCVNYIICLEGIFPSRN
ncbi:MAG: tail fiber protein [Ferruginibacter sp.]